jgi:hypothetical protein
MDRLLPFRTRLDLGLDQFILFACVATLLVIGGCKKAEEIREYTLTGPPLRTATHRMLAAIVPEEQSVGAKESSDNKTASSAGTKERTPSGPQAWFFKLTGPLAHVEPVAAEFDQFVASVRTGKGDRPQWTLPEGWTEEVAARSREFGLEAMIRIGQGESQLELTVSKLAMPANGRESWTLGNINRWRDQLNLPAIGRGELDEFTDEIKAGDQTAIKVDFRGTSAGSTMSRGLAAAKAAHDAAGVTAAPARSRPAATGRGRVESRQSVAGPLPFEAQVPTEWKPVQLKQFSLATYEIEGDNGDRAAEMTVTPLGPRAGDLRLNVDRWRGAFKQPKQVKEQTTTIEVDGQKADYVSLIGAEDESPREATLGVILPRADAVWFFKLWGQADVVEREKQRFEEYVKSVKFK